MRYRRRIGAILEVRAVQKRVWRMTGGGSAYRRYLYTADSALTANISGSVGVYSFTAGVRRKRGLGCCEHTHRGTDIAARVSGQGGMHLAGGLQVGAVCSDSSCDGKISLFRGIPRILYCFKNRLSSVEICV